jgi:hypothetical protein
LLPSFFLFFFSLWDWSLNSGLPVSKAGALPLEPYLQSILFWLFWRWGGGLLNYFPQFGLWTKILLISTSQVARITGMSHWHPALRFPSYKDTRHWIGLT